MNETEFAYRVRQALNEGAEKLDYRVLLRLERARRTALARQKAPAAQPLAIAVPGLALAAAGHADIDPANPSRVWLRRVALLVPVLVLAVGFVAISRWREEQEIAEHANIDLAVLLDDTPIDTYADKGFGVMIRDEQGI